MREIHCERTILEAKWEMLVRAFTSMELIEGRKWRRLHSISYTRNKTFTFRRLEACFFDPPLTFRLPQWPEDCVASQVPARECPSLS
jgi:hypothetical protein